MVARVPDAERKLILADRDELSIRQLAAKYHRSPTTIQNILRDPGVSEEAAQLIAQKNAQNTEDILAYMDSKREQVCAFIGMALDTLCDRAKLDQATLSQITTAMGTLIDKFTRQLPAQRLEVQGEMSLSDKMALIREAAREYGD